MPRRPRLAAGDLACHVLNRRVGRLRKQIEGQVLQSYVVIVLGNQRATIFHDADDYTARSADPKAETPIRHRP